MQLVIGNKNYSSWLLGAWLYLRESGVAFEEIRIPLYGDGAGMDRGRGDRAGDDRLHRSAHAGRRDASLVRMRSPAGSRLGGAVLACGLVAACASTPVPSRTLDVAPWARAQLEGARTVWIAAAVCRKGELASGAAAIRGQPAGAPGRPESGKVATPAAAEDGGPRTAAGVAPDGGCGVAGGDLGETLARAVRKARGIELAPARDRADLVLYFEQADRLRCFFCPQAEDRWHWWGLVMDPAGRELASMHGETTVGPGVPARHFVSSVKSLTRRGGDKKGT